MGCLLLALARQGLCEERRMMMAPVMHGPPYWMIDKGQYSGLLIDIERLITEKLNWGIDFIECPSFKRCILLAEEGKLDIGGALSNKGSKDRLYYLQPPLETTTSRVAFYLSKDAVDIKRYDDLSGLKVGTMIGHSYFEPFDSDSSIQKVRVPGAIQLFKMLEAGRIDAIVSPYEDVSDEMISRSRYKTLFKKADYRVERKAAYHIVIPKKSPFSKDKPKIEEVLRQLVESGKVREIYKQYGLDWDSLQAPK